MAVAMVVAMAPAEAAQPDPAPPTLASGGSADALETPAEALAADAALYAAAFDVPFAEALRRLEAQEASVALVDRLVQANGDRLAGVVIEHRPTYRIVINVRGEPAGEQIIATAPFGVPVVLRGGARSTRSASLNALERHQADIRAALAHPPAMGVDPHSGALLILTRAGDAEGEEDKAETQARLEAIAGVSVELSSWGDLDTDLSIEGGGRVAGPDGDGGRRGTCTSGFVVTDGERTALSTAAHCPDALEFIDRDNAHTPLELIGAWGARSQDVQLHAAPGALPPLFHGESPLRARPATTWRNRNSTRAGDFVCHRGERTGYSCALVQIVDFAPPGDLCAGPCPATWVAVAGPACNGGDSGGPVFLGTTAFGLMKGATSVVGRCKVYYYMSIDYLPPGWTVLHAPGIAPVPTAPVPSSVP